MAGHGEFRLHSAVLNDDGSLEVEVVVPRGRWFMPPKYRLIAASRDDAGESSQRARHLRDRETGERRVAATFAPADLGRLSGNHHDVFVEGRHGRHPVLLGPGQRAWQPYPTKYGNFSTKRMAAKGKAK